MPLNKLQNKIKSKKIKIKKYYYFLLILLLLLIFTCILFIWQKYLANNLIVSYQRELRQFDLIDIDNNSQSTRFITNIKGREFELELALSPAEHYQGLSNRDYLCSYCGMLFLFPQAEEQSFVMRNMNFSLDIIFIAPDNSIVKIYKNLPPEGSYPSYFYNSLKPVNKVLELNAGMSDILNLKEGDNLIFYYE